MRTKSTQLAGTNDELLASVVRLQPLLRENTSGSDAMRRLPDEVIDRLTDTGLFRLVTPRRFGGYDVDQRTSLKVTEMLGRANGSAAWLVGIAATAALLARCGSERMQSEVFSSLNVRLAGSLNPSSARRVDGGLFVSGSWPFMSGAPHAQWVAICAAIPDEPDDNDGPYVCFVPASQMQIRDTWHVVGMRGTASQTLATEGLFVPKHRTIALKTLANGEAASGKRGAAPPLGVLATLNLVGPLLGLGQAAAEWVIETAPSKSLRHATRRHQSDSVGMQTQLAEAKLQIRTARLHAYEVADALDAGTLVGDERYPLRAQAKAQCGYAAQQVINAIQILMSIHGAAGFADSSPMQQYWRDANVAARHAALNCHAGYEIFGKSLLGIPERISPLV